MRHLHDSGPARLTRRQILERTTLTAAGMLLADTLDATQATTVSASAKVHKVLESIVQDTPEIGLQVAAYLDGKLVVDAWAGRADTTTGKAVDGDTMFMLSSTTKGITATCMHVCVEKHKLSYDMPISRVQRSSKAPGLPRCLLQLETPRDRQRVFAISCSTLH